MLFALLALAARPALANIDVNLTGVDGELRSNILIFLSVERNCSNDEVDADTMQRLFDRVDGEVRGALRPLGYYDPEVRATFSPQGRNNWRVDIHVTPGEPVRLRELKISIEGPGADDPAFEGIRSQTA